PGDAGRPADRAGHRAAAGTARDEDRGRGRPGRAGVAPVLGHGRTSGRRHAPLTGLQDRLDLQDDPYLLAERHAAAGDGTAVRDAEVRPVDLAGGAEPGPGAGGRVRCERVEAEAVDLELQHDRPGDALEGEL